MIFIFQSVIHDSCSERQRITQHSNIIYHEHQNQRETILITNMRRSICTILAGTIYVTLTPSYLFMQVIIFEMREHLKLLMFSFIDVWNLRFKMTKVSEIYNCNSYANVIYEIHLEFQTLQTYSTKSTWITEISIIFIRWLNL